MRLLNSCASHRRLCMMMGIPLTPSGLWTPVNLRTTSSSMLFTLPHLRCVCVCVCVSVCLCVCVFVCVCFLCVFVCVCV